LVVAGDRSRHGVVAVVLLLRVIDWLATAIRTFFRWPVHWLLNAKRGIQHGSARFARSWEVRRRADGLTTTDIDAIVADAAPLIGRLTAYAR